MTQVNSDLQNQVATTNSNLTAFKDTTTSLFKNEPCALDNNASSITFYKSYGTVCAQMSFTIAWNIKKDITEFICAIPIGFIPQLNRWLLTRTYNTDKACSFELRKNENNVWCLFLTATTALSAGDVINTSFVYQLY